MIASQVPTGPTGPGERTSNQNFFHMFEQDAMNANSGNAAQQSNTLIMPSSNQ